MIRDQDCLQVIPMMLMPNAKIKRSSSARESQYTRFQSFLSASASSDPVGVTRISFASTSHPHRHQSMSTPHTFVWDVDIDFKHRHPFRGRLNRRQVVNRQFCAAVPNCHHIRLPPPLFSQMLPVRGFRTNRVAQFLNRVRCPSFPPQVYVRRGGNFNPRHLPLRPPTSPLLEARLCLNTSTHAISKMTSRTGGKAGSRLIWIDLEVSNEQVTFVLTVTDQILFGRLLPY